MRIEHHGLQDLVGITGRPFCAFGGQTAGTVDLLGRKILRAVQSDQIMPAFQLVGVQLLAPLQPVEQLGKSRVKGLGGDLIQGLTQGVVAGDVPYCKHRLQIAVLRSILHASLKGEHGRVLEKHHSQGAHQAVMQTIVKFPRLAGIVDRFEKRRQGFSHRAEAQMFLDMHAISIAIYNLL